MTRAIADDITVVILAGGAGRRMGGQDKGLVEFQDSPLVSHVINAIRAQSRQIVINANRNQNVYAKFGYPVIADRLDGFQGPLAGFLSAMQSVNSDYILTLPCDGPVVATTYLASMLQTLNESDCKIVVASDGERMQPVYALIPVELVDDLQAFLAAGERKIDRWYARHSTCQCEFSVATGFFTNINTPDELNTAP